MKKHTFTVTLTFADKITSDEEIQELAQNVANAVTAFADTAGIAPEASESYLTSIEVTPQFLPEAKIEVAYDFNKGWANK